MNDFGLTGLFVSVIVLVVLGIAGMGGLWKLVEMYFERTENERNE